MCPLFVHFSFILGDDRGVADSSRLGLRILCFGGKNDRIFPLLGKVAEKYLRTVATFVPAQWLFSKAEDTFNQKCNRLKPENVMLVNANVKL